ncbi:hypothetical protein N0V83_007978 [Neocucurbitaria cava]|uniref:Uncharacterized protein n=1 Tax=Neocucurbitaria cava TaxID=798079 RepID=A0A9W8Y3B4_9PLEO|nr:hypothetical protein N0V83_007978 [Neocucurbitaria cava]
MELQQMSSPCEARQVFTAVCVEDPLGCYRDMNEAVVKIKFQIRASQATFQYYEDNLATYQENLIHYPESRIRAQQLIDKTKAALYLCIHPTGDPNEDTVQEIVALQRSLDLQCQNAPQFLDFAESAVQPGMHREGIFRGYCVVTLMTKVPGFRVPYTTFCGWSPAQRDEMREAFKKALLEVWKCGIRPNDCALRNIVWDERERKCYIVDFEDSQLFDPERTPLPKFDEFEFRLWGIDEERAALLYKDKLG